MTILAILAWIPAVIILAIAGVLYTITINMLVYMTRVTKKFWQDVDTAKATAKTKWKAFKSEHNF